MAGDPKNFELRFRQTWPTFGLISIETERGNTASAASQSAKLITLLESLLVEEPANTEVKRGLARSHFIRAKAMAAFNRAAARRELAEAQKLISDMEGEAGQARALEGFRKTFEELERQLDAT